MELADGVARWGISIRLLPMAAVEKADRGHEAKEERRRAAPVSIRHKVKVSHGDGDGTGNVELDILSGSANRKTVRC